MKRDLLLVIDMQNVYTPGGKWCCPASADAAANIRHLIREKENLDVIFTAFTATENPEGCWIKYNEENADVNASVYDNAMMPVFEEERKRYPLYEKSVYSAMHIPEVKAAAKKAGRVVVSGVVAECCVLATVMELIDAGIPLVYLTDACAGVDAETEKAVQKVLEGLSPLHLEMMTTEEYLKNA